MRYKLTIEYAGGPFVGWQRQDNGRSVQLVLEEAIKKFSGQSVTVMGAGRTDAGVHALGQVAHIDLDRDWPGATVRNAMNAFMQAEPVSVLAAEAVSEGFDARFSAKARHYRYRILVRRPPPAIERGLVWWVAPKLDADAMHAAGQALVGTHDFTTFRASRCQAKSPIRTLDRLSVVHRGDEIMLDVSARSFLHNQVRSIAGSLKLVGEGLWPMARIAEALAACDRTACGPVAPPEGLYLVGVDY
jgi:tRNA pseudouridine38-40 synthase